jgi:penicillin amidase
MHAKRILLPLALLAGTAVALGTGPCSTDLGEIVVPGLGSDVKVVTDNHGVRHLMAEDDFDSAIAQGFVHCRDRLFQMDQTRRQVDGTEAELLGPGRLNADIQARVIGLHRAAQRSFDAAPARFKQLLEAYAGGVNHCIDQLEASDSLPPEYGVLELTQVRPWTPVDSLKIGKAISASLSLDVDTGLTEDFATYVAVLGAATGQTFFTQDVFRSAPMDPASTIPDATNGTPYAVTWKPDAKQIAAAGDASRRVRERMESHPIFELALNRREHFVGSNEWGVTGSKSLSGRPMIANDPHLSLNIPSTFYEWRLAVANDPEMGPQNVNGIGFPGTPGVILGQNDHITWGATTNPMDVSDVFNDRLHVAQPACIAIGALACIESPPGSFHAVELQLNVTYRFNVVGDGVDDNLVQATGLPPEATTLGQVPFRSFGPIIFVANPGVLTPPFGSTDALVLQYTGFHATQELQTFSIWSRAKNLAEFQTGLAKFDVGSQNWAYADVDGNLGYFTSAELPLRPDLEQGMVVGVPPWFVRDGKSGLHNWILDPTPDPDQAVPFEILPYAEMPQTLNPENGFFVNANNDPAGTTLDNDPLNQFRIGNPNGIYYLNASYADGNRAGRITQLILDEGQVSVHDMKEFQANTQQLDAERLVPFLLTAFDNASAPGAPPELTALASDPQIEEAVERLDHWDFATPTGIKEGYDAKDLAGIRLPSVSIQDAKASVAATIYNLWRGKAIRRIVDARLTSLGIPNNAFPGGSEALKALAHLLSQSPYTGVGAAGIDWIPQPAALSAGERRDLALLAALRDALDTLASPEFAPAFGGSTNQADYRWGKLHRIVLDHPLSAIGFTDFNIPTQAGFSNLAPDLLGLARDGGYEVVNASGFNARAIGLNSFMFGGGPVRRYVGQSMTPHIGIAGVNVIPGGPSGIPGSADYATQLGLWLTADYHLVNMSHFIPNATVETLTSAP